MAEKVKNRNLQTAKSSKKDEFYTQLSDIEKELRHYKAHFKDKVVYCNCDDPRVSNFFHYFSYNFEKLGLKKLITTCYKNQNMNLFSSNDSEQAIYLEYNGDKSGNNVPDPEEIGIRPLEGDGDFRSQESIELLKQADIVVTNPPFSLFREYVAQLVEHDKKFLIIGNVNAITYKEIFKLIKEDRLWLGPSIRSGDREFGVPDDYPLNAAGYRVDGKGKKYIRVKGVRWFTNLDYRERHEDLILYKPYNQAEYPRYDNYDAVEVSKTKDIPADYEGAMGVPITFLDKYNPGQFQILGITDRDNNSGLKTKEYTEDDVPNSGDLNRRGVIKIGNEYRSTYARLLIKRRSP
ncbi:adenine-specific methyltransferase EcoRI family protein [Geoalkalibacter halelectricus]|uniref:adenine-specific methyltransferase EcoRI family protein n=1 Tax=Geoalkalibacter halelectricus TaxID=2847045 RepID=UPI00266F412E|nr:adenine-specific methyltransferase EcoRI family protein [Geoalkalibacter halelectricus]MDO3380464.1 adenine-specific methyltransferase EcoRI family protein [Geoalkalibacter halelectricus]